MKEYGVDLAVKMMQALRKEGIRGYHLCTLNLEKSVTRVLEKLEWVTDDTRAAKRLKVQITFLLVSGTGLKADSRMSGADA